MPTSSKPERVTRGSVSDIELSRIASALPRVASGSSGECRLLFPRIVLTVAPKPQTLHIFQRYEPGADLHMSAKVKSLFASFLIAVTLMSPQALAAAPLGAPSWTGWYGGIEFGDGWSSRNVSFAPNDPLAAALFNATGGVVQPLVSTYGLTRSGAVGGLELGYNWQVDPRWILGIEADFSGSAISGKNSGPLAIVTGGISGATTAQQNTDWYGTARGRLGWLATPNLLLFGTGGLAYGRTNQSANYDVTSPVFGTLAPFGFSCITAGPCFTGSSSTTRTGWTTGGGIEWMLDQHWTAKVEYQFVDLGSDSLPVVAIVSGLIPSSMTVNFRDTFNVVRLGLNYRM